jgi:hypothetical protein
VSEIKGVLETIDPGLEVYYKSTADLLAIYWQYHKERLERKNLHYAYNSEGKAFDLGKMIKHHDPNSEPIDVLGEYGEGVERSIVNSWFQFAGWVGAGVASGDFFNWNIGIPDYSKRFFAPYVRDLYTQTWGLGAQHTQAVTSEFYKLHEIVNNGMNTGIIVSTYFSALLEDSFSFIPPHKLAKIKLRKSRLALNEIGAQGKDLPKVDHGEQIQDPEYFYPLLDPEKILDPKRLHELGYGKTPGCPARMRPTDETIRFLRDECGVIVSGIMLQEFAVMNHKEFGRLVREPYEALSEEQRIKHISLNTRLLLDGEVWEAVKSRSKKSSGRCPITGKSA